MLKSSTLCSMIDRLLMLPEYSMARIAKQIGVHEETIKKIQDTNDYQLMPAKQLALIKLYCSEEARL
jgi:transposase-like protein